MSGCWGSLEAWKWEIGKTSDDSTVLIVPALIVIIQGTFDEVVYCTL